MKSVFKRGEAITRLEHYADVIVLHLTLLICFPKAQEISHWQQELNAFKGVLQRYNNSKSKKGHNYSVEDIETALLEVIEDNEGKDYIANDIMGTKKGMDIDSHNIDWEDVEKSISSFAQAVLGT
ncbi:hypothetical protein JYT19_00855 [Sulfobacillus acidophilus]|uniref:Uncharacterized protein n=1 Tax=Sulfobacillus acidophilus TaxID=53633 RepID=A0ABS3AWG1_9FIRM|nr:hypothetical protein [Sulfobacillus acidophilus]